MFHIDRSGCLVKVASEHPGWQPLADTIVTHGMKSHDVSIVTLLYSSTWRGLKHAMMSLAT